MYFSRSKYIDKFFIKLALLAFMEQMSYSVDEATERVNVCVVLEGRLEASLSLSLVTEDMSATGIQIHCISSSNSHNP